MLRKINSALRTTVIVAGVVILAAELVRELKGNDTSDEYTEKDDFQKEEFDDIW